MNRRLQNGLLVALALAIMGVLAFHGEARLDREVICPLCAQIGREYHWFELRTGRDEDGGCCHELWRKHVGGDCSHRWLPTGNSTRRNIFGFPIVYACGARVAGPLAQGTGLRELEDAGYATEVALGFEIISCLGQKEDLRQLEAFLGELRPDRAGADGNCEACCAQVIRDWAAQLRITGSAEVRP